MHIRTFRAANLNAALAMIREEMGPEASVLHTRQVPASRLKLFGRPRIEVTAGLKPLRCSPSASAPSSVSTPSDDARAPEAAPATAATPPRAARAEVARAEPAWQESPRDRGLGHPIALAPGIATSLAAGRTGGEPTAARPNPTPARPTLPRRGIVATPDSPTAFLIEELIASGLPPRIATEWARRSDAPTRPRRRGERPAGISVEPLTGPGVDERDAGGLEAARGGLAQWLERSMRIGPPIEAGRGRRRVVALVGPTGVGKTTTVAKLAAGFQLQQNIRVGLMTLDTFRAAAIEQLDAFARTLGVPLAVVRTASEVAGALERLEDVDLVLIDTVGQSPRSEEKIAAMGRLLAAARPDEIHLVVDANGSFNSAADTCAAFAPLRPTATIISKLDEVRRPAPVIAAVLEGALQISYLTHGQRVPEDIATADRPTLAAAASGLAAVGCGA